MLLVSNGVLYILFQREARARKKAMDAKLKQRWQRDDSERVETDAMLKEARNELNTCQQRCSEYEFELRQAKYDMSQMVNKYNKLKEEKDLSESIQKNKLLESQFQLESTIKRQEEKYHIIAMESEKNARILEKMVSQVGFDVGKKHDGGRTYHHLLEKVVAGNHRIRTVVNSSSGPLQPIETSMMATVESAVDSAMLEMCRNLEEENVILTERVESLKQQVQETQRTATASQLIPHYRLAIVR
jgi:hypothetical protein